MKYREFENKIAIKVAVNNVILKHKEIFLQKNIIIINAR